MNLTLTKKLLDSEAKNWAKRIYGDRKDPQTSKTQIRAFYDKLLEYYNEVFLDKKEFDDVLPFIKMLKSKVAYAKGRKVVKGQFVNFMNDGIDAINSKEDLKNFKLLFEAVLGYFVGLEFEKKENK